MKVQSSREYYVVIHYQNYSTYTSSITFLKCTDNICDINQMQKVSMKEIGFFLLYGNTSWERCLHQGNQCVDNSCDRSQMRNMNAKEKGKFLFETRVERGAYTKKIQRHDIYISLKSVYIRLYDILVRGAEDLKGGRRILTTWI